MKIIDRPFEGSFLLQPAVYRDNRGFFSELFNLRNFRKITGLDITFVQDNLAGSRKNVFRGMHFQRKPYEQAKLVSCLRGKILDIIVDLRPESDTFLQSYQVELSEENRYQLFVPKGFAHGYLALTGEVLVWYKTDEFYHPEADGGFHFRDPSVNIVLSVEDTELILSAKDKQLPFIKDLDL